MRVSLRRSKQPAETIGQPHGSTKESTRINQRQFLRALGVLGTVGAAQILTPHSVEAAYSTGSGGDTVNTNLTVQGNLTVTGGSTLQGDLTVSGRNTNILTTASNGYNVVLTTPATANKRTRLAFYQNTSELWSVLTDTALNGTGDFAIWDGTAQVNRLTIDTAGQVGIGTTTPGALLNVNGDLNVGGNIEVSNASGGYNGMVFWGDTNWGFAVVNPSSPSDDFQARVSYYSNPGGNRKVGFWDARQNLYPLYVDTNGTNVVVEGNLGVGTSSPQAALDVNGFIQTDGARMLINGFDADPGFFWFRTTGPEPGSVFMAFGASPGGDAVSILIGPQGSWGIYVNDTGQVGIGNVSPAHTLDVSGPIGANGNFGIIFPGTDNWDSLHWNVSSGTLRIGVASNALRIEGNSNFVGTISVNNTLAIDATGYAMNAHQASQAYYS